MWSRQKKTQMDLTTEPRNSTINSNSHTCTYISRTKLGNQYYSSNAVGVPCDLWWDPSSFDLRKKINNPCTRKRFQQCHAQPPGEGDASIRDQAKRLDRLFYSDVATDKTVQADEGDTITPNAQQPQSQRPSIHPAILRDLPLWRVQWAVLPGYQEVLHVHVPHYVDLFSRVTAGARPFLFGHVLLPGGSASLGLPEYTLEPGSQAPLVGTLMEIMQAVKFPDGRMLILAAALGKFKILNPLQLTPHSRADVVILPDAEELSTVYGDNSNEENATAEAAYAAAVAASREWWHYEASAGRVHQSVALIDGDDEEASLAFGRRLVSIGSNEVVKLPFSYTPQDMSREMAEKVEGDELRDAAMAAREAGEEAAARVRLASEKDSSQEIDNNNTENTSSNCGNVFNLSEFLKSPINSVEERNPSPVPAASTDDTSWPEEALSSEEDPNALPDINSALYLEAKVWEELDAVLELAHKISGRVAPLAEGLLCLRPPPSFKGGEIGDRKEGGWSGEDAHPEYPPLRRSQRLSYAVASTLGSIGTSEGRQAWLECASVTERLRLGLAALRKHRNVLAAVVAVRKLESGGEES